jgi:hypothetical protein
MRHLEHSHRRLVVTAAITAGLVVLVAGCSGNSKKSASTAVPAASASAAYGGIAEPAAPASAPFAAPSPSAAASSAAAAAGESAPASLAPGVVRSQVSLLHDRDIIYVADITVRAKDVTIAVGQVRDITNGQEGIVFAEQVNRVSKDPQSPAAASATMTLKVPPNQLDPILDQIGRVGTELSRNKHSDDVTGQVVDVGARIGAANDSLTRLRQLFQHAGNVTDLANVEGQIAQREADLESLESQQRTLAAQTAAATITVNLVATPPVIAPIAPTKHAHVVGFVKGLHGGWHAFTKAVSGFATAVGALLPFLVVLLILGLCAVIVRRRMARSHPADDVHAQPEPTS